MKKSQLVCLHIFRKSIRWFTFLVFFTGFAANVSAQTIRISGIVTDAQGETMPGVNIIVKGSTTGNVTDLDGNYEINVPGSESVLVYSFIGFATQEIMVGERRTIDVILQESSQQLDEVVVIGYGTAKKRDLTGSIVSVRGDEVAGKPSSNPLASLQGKVAGVQVVNTGRAGQDPEIRIRGTNSINGFAPLYVVDGLFTDNINYINPADIESMEILKDPSSLAIFGVRGANGVIIVTMKRAKEGRTTINVNSTIGWKAVHDKIDVTNAAQFKELYNEQRMNQKATPFDYTNWGYDTDWQDEIFQTGFLNNNNISITAATDKSRFYMSLGYLTEEGNIETEKYSKLTVNLGSDYDVTKFLRFGFRFNGMRALPPDAKNVGSAVVAAPIARVHEETTGLLYTMPDFQRAQVRNPMIAIETLGRHNIAQNYRGGGNIYGEVDFLQHFKFKVTLSIDYRSDQNRSYTPIIYVYNPDVEGEDKKERTTDSESISQSKSSQLATQQDYILTYENKFGDHNLIVMAGMTTNYNEYSSITAGRSQNYNNIIFSVPNDNPDKWWITAIDETAMTNDGDQWASFTMSWLARALYNYRNRYLFNASYRRDGASTFSGVDNIWENFYSFGGAWIMSEENFLKNQKFLDYLKIKASWGVLGTQNTGGRNYPTYPVLLSSGSAVFGDRIVAGYNYDYAVQDLGWEKTKAWEAGFEASFLKNRLRLESVYYNKKTENMIVLLDPRNGKINELQNMGSIRNRGVEITASWADNIGAGGFSYSLGANLTTIDNEVISLGRDDSDAITSGAKSIARTAVGYPISYFYGYKVAGIYQNNQDIKTSPPNSLSTSLAPGDLKFADTNGDQKINGDDRTMIGNPTPDFTYGFNIGLSYKGFDLGVDMMGTYGNEIYRTWDDPTFARLNYLTHSMNRWHGEGTSNWEPVIDPSRAINQMTSNYFIEDGSFFRIRNVQLGYTFNPEVMQRIFVKQLRIYGNIQNLKTWSRNTGYVPEIGGTAIAFGIDEGTYPMPAIYTLGINLIF